MNILQQIEQIEIKQLWNLGSGTIEEALDLHRQKHDLVILHRIEQMAIQDEKLIKPESFIKRLFRLWKSYS